MAAIGGGCGCASAPPPPLLALKYNNKPYQLTMMKFHHHHHHRGGGLVSQSERAKLKLKPIMASSSSSSSSSSSPMSNQAKQALQNRSAVSALWARLHPTSIVFFVVVLRDEDDLIKKKFDRIVFKFQRFRNYRGSLVESIDCLLNNADSIISSSTVVCCSYLQSAGNVAKLDKFMQRRFHGQRVAEDDISCTWVVLYMTTCDEISDEKSKTFTPYKILKLFCKSFD